MAHGTKSLPLLFLGYPLFVAIGRRRAAAAAPAALRGRHAARGRPSAGCRCLSEEFPQRTKASSRAAMTLVSPGVVGFRKQPATANACAAHCSQSELDPVRTKTGNRLRLASHRMHATNSSPLTKGRLASTRITKGAVALNSSGRVCSASRASPAVRQVITQGGGSRLSKPLEIVSRSVSLSLTTMTPKVCVHIE